jgi:hypothetical protein
MSYRPPPSPWAPSRRATARVTSPLPVPHDCIRCERVNSVEIESNAAVYGMEYGEWPWVYRCMGCGAYTGLHQFTSIPVGTLADEPTRRARVLAKNTFNLLWQVGGLTRTESYKWLSDKLGIQGENQCHIGWMEVDQCKATVEVCREWLLNRRTSR